VETARRLFEQMFDVVTGRAASTPLDDEAPLWALVVLDGKKMPEQVIVVFKDPAEADACAQLDDAIGDHRVVPLRFLPAVPREPPARGGSP
jgi:hypothetical protein